MHFAIEFFFKKNQITHFVWVSLFQLHNVTLALDLLNDTGLQMSSVDPQGEETTHCSHKTHSAFVGNKLLLKIKIPQRCREWKKNEWNNCNIKKKTLELQDSNVRLIQIQKKNLYLHDRETPKPVCMWGEEGDRSGSLT